VLELEEILKNRAVIAFEQVLFEMCVCNSSQDDAILYITIYTLFKKSKFEK
jgi:hypothetical protein